jgi:CBS domain-containing membrane protein
VIDPAGRLIGIVGLRELARPAARVADVMKAAVTAKPQTPAFERLAALTDGTTHAVVVVDDDRRILGLVTQTDLLIAISRLPALPKAA